MGILLARRTSFFLFVLGAWTAYCQNAVTQDNWQSHPAIVEIGAIVSQIDAMVEEGLYRETRSEFPYSEPWKDVWRQRFTDTLNETRKLYREAGSDDSSLNWAYYYDDSGVLRFVFITGGAVNGTVIDHRIYFDASGQRIWEVQERLEGPGYTFPTEWPDTDLIFDPDARSK